MTPDQLLRAVSRLLPRHFDLENIAADLWLSAWIAAGSPKGVLDVPISHTVVYGRCVDAIRHRAIQESATLRERPRTNGPVDSPKRRVSFLIDHSSIEGTDQRIIFLRFYLGKTLREISRELALPEREISSRLFKSLERLRAVARIHNVRAE